MELEPALRELPTRLPRVGDLVYVRTRTWLVEDVVEPKTAGHSARVRLACADDDAQGQQLEIYWSYELDRRILEEECWKDLGSRGFDSSRRFSAFLNTLRWSCVTATDPNLFQAPFRAGIKIDAYQMEPLRKALQLPRVNLFIADDTGLGKTIEAGLVARELLLRKKVKTIVVSAPPSVLEQWKGELEDRFGLIFEILDRKYVMKMRRERGYGVNPWRTHSRFLVSHRLLVDETYNGPKREWLGSMQVGSLLILDEAHHAAPSSSGNYGIESKFTRAIRDIASRFEHRLFLSATPHNGHSNSFSTLLEILDPYRFTRGVKVSGERELKEVMVRRLKEDIRNVQGGFPRRHVLPIVIDKLPDDTPELLLSKLLDEYRELREERHKTSSKRAKASAGLLVVGLQQRLLSSIEAFARTLAVHRKTVERHWQKGQKKEAEERAKRQLDEDESLFLSAPDSDDDRAEWTNEELEAQEAAQVTAITEASEAESLRDDDSLQIWKKEQALLDRMQKIAEQSRYQPDQKMLRLLDWVRSNLCPGLPESGKKVRGESPSWNDRRLLIFTENREGTKMRLREVLEAAISGTDQAEDRIAVIDGLTAGETRRDVQRRFNTDPGHEPLRILIATDAAREGLNFQAHCTDLIHFDLPWNPGRIEQRNGRIDRKLQPAGDVYCHYFVLPQRVEDRVLDVLVKKTETIKRELGSLSKVIDDNIEDMMKGGIRHRDAEKIAEEVDKADIDEKRKTASAEEFEAARERSQDLEQQIKRCQDLLEKSREWISFKDQPFRDALSCSLELIGADPLQREDQNDCWRFPVLDRAAEADPSWAATLDTLRVPRKRDQKLLDWRREAPIRPVVFDDVGVLNDDKVHLHLEQRVAQRLLARFRAQGFVYHDLSRACLAQAKDSIPRVVLLGRLSLYGQGAERLHEEIVPVAARWIAPEDRKEALKAYAREAEDKTLQLLDQALGRNRENQISRQRQTQLLTSAKRDIEELRPQLEPRGEELAEVAIKKLRARGEREAKELATILERQKKRVEKELKRNDDGQLTFDFPDLNDDERRQLEANIKSWHDRVRQFERDLVEEPERLRRFYEVKARRIEPVGLVYLWPETN